MILQQIGVNDIFIDENRTEGGYGDVASLAASIKEFGQITPIAVVELSCEHPHYRVMAGRRRIAAFKALAENDSKYESIQACVYAIDELHGAGTDEEDIALAENTAREAMNPLDEGHAFAKLLRGGKSAEEVGAIFCRSRSQVYQRAKLDDLLPELKEAYKRGFITLTQAARFASVDASAQGKIVEGLLLYKNQKNLMSWQADDLLRKALPLKIGKCFTCEACATCTRRTHFDDATLFEELANGENFCLDDECYNKHWLDSIAAAISSCKEIAEKDGAEIENVIIRDSQMLPGEAGGKLLVDGEEYTVLQNKDVAFIYEYQKEEYEDILHPGLRLYYPARVELVTYASAKEKKLHDAKKSEERKLKEDEKADAVLSALPTPVRKQAIQKANGKGIVEEETLYRVAVKSFSELTEDEDLKEKAGLVLFASRLAEDIDRLPNAARKVFAELSGVEDASYEAISKMSVDDLVSLQSLYDILYSIRWWNAYDITLNKDKPLIKRLEEAGAPLNFQKFIDDCVTEQYRDLLEEHAREVMPVEPDALTDDESEDTAPGDDEYIVIEDEDDEKN